MMVLAIMHLLVLHTPGGHEITLNAKHIISLRNSAESEGAGKDNKHVTSGVKCVIFTEDGKFISVIETCAEVRHMLQVEQ